jgi:Protein of unknown function (DUF3352)
MTRKIRIWLASIVGAALAATAAGCGGTATSASGGGTAGAAVVPADALAYVAIDTDLSSSQWKTVDDLLNKFPGKDQLLAKLKASFENDTKASWENDVKPALGKEADIAVFGTKPNVVLLTQPADKAKFDALVKKLDATSGGDPSAVGEVNGWTVLSDSPASIAAFNQASSGNKLADDSTFTEAMGALSDDALVKAYANGAKITEALKNAGIGGTTVPQQLKNLTSGVAELVASGNGLKLDGKLKSSGGQTLQTYTPKLVDKVPTGALAFLSFKGTQSLQLGSLPKVGFGFGAIFQKLSTILANENAIYVRPGTPIPEITLVATPNDPQAASQTVSGLLKQVGAKVKPAQNGVSEANFGRFSVYYGVADGDFIVTDSNQGIADFKGGSSLRDDPTFKEAVDASGLPDKTTGFLYVNLKDAVPLAESLAQLSGTSIPPLVSNNLAPLRTFTVYGTGKPGEIAFTAFLEVK